MGTGKRRSAAVALQGDDNERSGVALLIVDMINLWRGRDGARLKRAALTIAPRIARLRERAEAAGIATVYVNDNFGQWRSDFRRVQSLVQARGGDGAAIAELLAPRPSDYFVLKPTQSAFHGTPLDQLLRHLETHTLVLTGVAADQCVLVSAGDAHVRGYGLVVPTDAVAAAEPQATRATIAHFRRLGQRVTASTRLRFESLRPPA